MKIAVSSQGDSLESNLDPRFGRASYIIIADNQTGRVIDVIQKFKQGNVVYADKSNKDGHW